MKNLSLISLSVIILSVFSGCAVHQEAASNLNLSQTSVVLQQRNFKVVGSVSGQVTQTYVLGIGGMSKKLLRESALSEMYRKADLNGKPRAIVNVNVRYKHQFLPFPIFYKYRVVATGDIIEFTE